jgi:hypothetical protein
MATTAAKTHAAPAARFKKVGCRFDFEGAIVVFSDESFRARTAKRGGTVAVNGWITG